MQSLLIARGSGKEISLFYVDVSEARECLFVEGVGFDGELVFLLGLGSVFGVGRGVEGFGELEMNAGKVWVGGDSFTKACDCSGDIALTGEFVCDGLMHLAGLWRGEGEHEE